MRAKKKATKVVKKSASSPKTEAVLPAKRSKPQSKKSPKRSGISRLRDYLTRPDKFRLKDILANELFNATQLRIGTPVSFEEIDKLMNSSPDGLVRYPYEIPSSNEWVSIIKGCPILEVLLFDLKSDFEERNAARRILKELVGGIVFCEGPNGELGVRLVSKMTSEDFLCYFFEIAYI